MRLPFQLRIGCWETKNLAGVSHWVMLTLKQASFSWIFALFFDTSFQSARLNFSHWNNTEKNGTFSLFETIVKETVTFAYIMTFHFHSVFPWTGEMLAGQRPLLLGWVWGQAKGVVVCFFSYTMEYYNGKKGLFYTSLYGLEWIYIYQKKKKWTMKNNFYKWYALATVV